MVLQVQRVLLARLAPQVQLEIKELRVLLDPQALLGLVDLQDHKDRRGIRVLLGQQARLEQLVLHQLLQDLLGQPGQQVRHLA